MLTFLFTKALSSRLNALFARKQTGSCRNHGIFTDVSPLDKHELAKHVTAAIIAIREARRINPEDDQLRGALILLKNVMARIDCMAIEPPGA